MGTEIVFVIIIPIAPVCLSIAIWAWFGVAGRDSSNALGRITGYGPVLAGFSVSMLILTINTYVECYSDFTALVQQGYYHENEREIYLPGRVVGQEIVELVFILPFICCLIIPLTARLIKTNRFTPRRIAIIAAIGWVILSLTGWLYNLAVVDPPYPISFFFEWVGFWILAYGLPIPIAAALFFREERTA